MNDLHNRYNIFFQKEKSVSFPTGTFLPVRYNEVQHRFAENIQGISGIISKKVI